MACTAAPRAASVPVGWEAAQWWAGCLTTAATVLAGVLFARQHREIVWVPYALGALLWFSRWHAARPDEWLLLLRDGQLLGQGVGLRAFCDWRDTVVKFPAAIQKVRFEATQVDKEMQGLQVSGFVNWSVDREKEGPWNAYKYLTMRDKDGDGRLDNDAGSQNVAEIAKAVIRHHIANSTIHEVLTKREALREKARSSIMEQVRGWGVWVEAVEITEVLICSNSLFQDLQAEFRHKSRRQAEEARLQAEREIQERSLADELHLARLRAEAEAEKKLSAARQRLRAEQEEAELFAKQAEAAKARIEMEREIELAAIGKNLAVEEARAAAEASVARIRKTAEVDCMRAQFEVERDMPQRTVQRMGIEATAQIFEKLPLKDLRLNIFGSDTAAAAGNSPAMMLPGAACLQQSWDLLQVTKEANRQ